MEIKASGVVASRSDVAPADRRADDVAVVQVQIRRAPEVDQVRRAGCVGLAEGDGEQEECERLDQATSTIEVELDVHDDLRNRHHFTAAPWRR